MSKKVIILLVAVLTLPLCYSVFALAKDVEKTAPINQTENEKEKAIPAKRLDLTKKQKVELQEKAMKYDIKVDGLTDEQIYEKIIAKDNDAMIAKAEEAGIDTIGLTPEKVLDKIEEKDKELPMKRDEEEKKAILEYALGFEINTTGLSYDQIKEKVYEKLMPGILEKAKELGVTSEGVDYNQLLLKVKAKEIEVMMNSGN